MNALDNTDVIHNILTFLDNDGTSVVRFALSSKVLYDRIMRQETCDPNLWKNLICNRWKRTRCRPTMFSNRPGRDESPAVRPLSIPHRDLYIEKRRADAQAIQRLDEMTWILQDILQLSETQPMIPNGNAHVGQAWEHQGWKFLLRNRADCYDVLKSVARRHIGKAPSSVRDRLRGFLAARCVQDFYLADCLVEWKRLEEKFRAEPKMSGKALQLEDARQLEEYILLVCEIQKTPFEILLDDSFCSNEDFGEYDSESNQGRATISRAKKLLDDIAEVCKTQIEGELGANASTTDKLKIVNDVLVNSYSFSGNTNDYYNHRNVLLDHVLESKTGMPITLCLLYCFVCRRLDIAVQVTGLPGHIILGFDANDEPNSRRSYIDVFRGCRFLTWDDCYYIVRNYGLGWREEYLDPLSTKMTIQRIFNNLRNCHEKALSHQEPPPFCTDLLFQQHTIGMVHRYESEIACTLLDRLSEDLTLVLSPDLLRAYNLLPERGMGRDPVVNATHARALLELSSYVELSYDNYA